MKMLEKIICFSYNIFHYDRIKVANFYNRSKAFPTKYFCTWYVVEWATQKLKTSLLIAGMVLAVSPSSDINLKQHKGI